MRKYIIELKLIGTFHAKIIYLYLKYFMRIVSYLFDYISRFC